MGSDEQVSEVGVLQGVVVVELTMWIAGPSAAGILADWGADVIKIEPPTGDPQRNILAAMGYRADLPNPSFALDNRGKRSVVLDLFKPEDLAKMENLLAGADVFLTNFRPIALNQMGLGPTQVPERHPHLVYTTITGYGLDGPESSRPGYDIGAFWARPGIARDLVPKDAAPLGVRSGLGDHYTGLSAVAGTLGALVERSRTGKGRVVEASLLRTGLWAVGGNVATQMTFGRLESTKPREKSPVPLVNCYQTGDGSWFWLIALESDRHFPGLIAAMDRPDLAADERFVDAKARRVNNEAFIAQLDATFASQPLSYWKERFDEFDVWWAPAQTMAEVLEDPQIKAAGGFVEIDDGAGGSYGSVNTPITFRGNQLRKAGPVPTVGQHTQEVFAEFGLSEG